MAGIILTNEFNLPGTWGSGYVNYIDDKSKALLDNVYLEDVDIFKEAEGIPSGRRATDSQISLLKEYYKVKNEDVLKELNFNQAHHIIKNSLTHSFVDYISNDKKVKNYAISKNNKTKIEECSFDLSKNTLNKNDLKQKEKAFDKASKNEAILYKGVFSFEDEYLIDNKILSIKNGKKIIDDELLKHATQNAVDRLMEMEKFNDTAVMHAGIHYNTDHIHVHFAIAEENPTKKKGKLKERNINKAKSEFVKNLEYNKDFYKELETSKKNIKSKTNKLLISKRSQNLLLEIANNLPKGGRLTYDHISPELQAKVDQLFEMSVKSNKNYKKYEKITKESEDKFKKIYGKDNDYSKAKMKQIDKELKNQILKQAKNIKEDKMSTPKNPTKSNAKYSSGFNLNKLESLLKKKEKELEREAQLFEKELEEELTPNFQEIEI